jgi:hypothetical protein
MTQIPRPSTEEPDMTTAAQTTAAPITAGMVDAR